MKIIIVGGPPSVGKTSVLVHTINILKINTHKKDSPNIAVFKLDCLVGGDDTIYKKHGIEIIIGLSLYICPDHYLATNIDRIIKYGLDNKLDYLIIESAGLCNRCSPHLTNIMAVTVMDMLSGISTPKKIGPLLKSADLVVLTRGDLISQAEREVFRMQIARMNKRIKILEVNGLTGQNSNLLASQFSQTDDYQKDTQLHLRYPMPAAVCSYCLGEKRVGEVNAKGNVRLIDLPEHSTK